MKRLLRSWWVGVALSVAAVATVRAATRPVVLELFTSQGCSSCPPAEVIVGELARRPDLLPLSFHVDYWDGLGWRDRYSLVSATQRQRRYARSLRLRSLYTPQVVVDGSRDIVGSDRGALMQAAATQRQGVATSLVLHDGMIEVVVGDNPGSARADVLLIGYLRESTTPIGRGENSGRTLKEFNIVLAIRELGQWTGTSRKYRVALDSLPSAVTDVAVLIQTAEQGAIVGAASQSTR